MKMRVGLEDIKMLGEKQKRSLMELWKPQKFDVAMASMCMDVENEEYDEFEFVVGQVAIDKHAHVYVYDYSSMPPNDKEATSDPEEETDAEPEEPFGDEDSDMDFDLSYIRPSFFNKEDCIPLLNIGQMIELLQRFDFGSSDFYLNAGNGVIGCEIGRTPANWVDYNDNEPQELCDVLWEMVKTVLG